MIHIIHCRTCDSHIIPLGTASCHITLSASEHCSSCHHSHERKYNLFFCSVACFVKFMEEKKDIFLENAKAFEANPRWPSGTKEGEDGLLHHVDLEKR